MAHRTPPPLRRPPESTLSRVRRMSSVEHARRQREEKPFDPEAPRESYARSHHFAVNSDAETTDIVAAMARAFFVSSWSDQEEEAGRTYSGQDLMQVAPPTPLSAVESGREFAEALSKANSMPVTALYEKCAAAPGKHTKDPTPENFGHYMAMQALGHGVSWWDDHPKVSGVKVPHWEYHWEGDEADEAEDEPDVSELHGLLETTMQEMADQQHAVALSSQHDDDTDDLEGKGFDLQTEMRLAACGDAFAVNGELLVSPHWVKELDVEGDRVVLWSEAKTAAGDTAHYALLQYLRKEGYKKVKGAGGEWTMNEEQELSVEHGIDATLTREASAELKQQAKEILKTAFRATRHDTVYWSASSRADTTVYALPLADD